MMSWTQTTLRAGLVLVAASGIVSGCSAEDNGGLGTRLRSKATDSDTPQEFPTPPLLDGGATSPGQSTSADAGCTLTLVGVVRDFRRGDREGGHPDFETFNPKATTGLVKDALGVDGKPVYAADGPTEQTSGKDAFDQWFRTIPGVNQEIPFRIVPEARGDGRFVYDSNAFFPIDNKGFGNEGLEHNFHFTFEVHSQFTYSGGETLEFRGDDDLWIFINGRLAMDLGGIHAAMAGKVDVDAMAKDLGLQLGQTYTLDVFQAERHTGESNFRIETSIRFDSCQPSIP
jgi:fibro-slime domain-containing protein